MNVKTKEMYSEVYSILNMLGNNYITRLPANLIKIINEEKLDTYNPKYEPTIALEKQNIQKETLAMIALFHLNYWCDSEEEKENLKIIFKNNEEKHQTEIREKYNPDNIFMKKEFNSEIEYEKENSVSMIEFKETIFKRILKKIMYIFNKK